MFPRRDRPSFFQRLVNRVTSFFTRPPEPGPPPVPQVEPEPFEPYDWERESVELGDEWIFPEEPFEPEVEPEPYWMGEEVTLYDAIGEPIENIDPMLQPHTFEEWYEEMLLPAAYLRQQYPMLRYPETYRRGRPAPPNLEIFYALQDQGFDVDEEEFWIDYHMMTGG